MIRENPSSRIFSVSNKVPLRQTHEGNNFSLPPLIVAHQYFITFALILNSYYIPFNHGKKKITLPRNQEEILFLLDYLQLCLQVIVQQHSYLFFGSFQSESN